MAKKKTPPRAPRPRRAFSSPPLREITDHGQRERGAERKRERKDERTRRSNTDKKKPERGGSGWRRGEGRFGG